MPSNAPMTDPLDLPLPAGPAMRFLGVPECSEYGFRMGSRDGFPSEEPPHRVRLTAPFFLGETPVTQAQFRCWTDSEAYARWLAEAVGRKDVEEAYSNSFASWAEPERPADSVTRHEAVGFCEWLTQLWGESLRSLGLVAILPTEVQWEYACRGGTCYWGEDADLVETIAWGDVNSNDTTHPVRQKAPNPWGFYDQIGNVWEWCLDFWASAAYRGRCVGASDPITLAAEADDPLAEGTYYDIWWRAARALTRILDGHLTRPSLDEEFGAFFQFSEKRQARSNPGNWVETYRALTTVVELERNAGTLDLRRLPGESVTELRRVRDHFAGDLQFREGERLGVIRGGSYRDRKEELRTTRRRDYAPRRRNEGIGFRVALAPEEAVLG